MGKAHILIVEDEQIVAKDIQQRLRALGYHIPAISSSGEDALKTAADNRPDLVLMDIRLKGAMDGVETAAEMRRRFNVPVVYLTAYADNHTLQRAKVTQPFGYIHKPFEERELYTCIEVALYKHQMEQKLRESEQWLVTTLGCIGDAVVATDHKGRVKFINHVAEELTGWTRGEASERQLTQVFHILTVEELAEIPVEGVMQDGQTLNQAREAILLAKNGSGMPIEYRAAAIRGESGYEVGIVVVFRDITERKQAEDKLRYFSTHDVLTGLHNRAYFEEELARLERGRQFPVSIIIGDVDRFKHTNDLHGHVAGDKLLREVAQVLKGAFRAEDVVTRIGGDEFAILLPLTDTPTARDAVSRIRQGLTTYNAAHKDCPLAVSFGIATAESGPLTEAMKEADKRMYREKLINRTRLSSS